MIENVEDKSDNKIAKTTVPFTVGDKTPPDHKEFVATLYKAGKEGQMLKIDFKDTMATDGNYSVTDVEKYVILDANKDKIKMLEDIDGVEIDVVDDGKSVEIFHLKRC